MGQAGSQPAAAYQQRGRRPNTLPHEPLRLAPKVLPSLPESPCLRSTDNGAILHSGGTISGRRPGSVIQENSRPPLGPGHSSVYRSRSAGTPGDPGEMRPRERDPLHRSHTNLDFRNNDNGSLSKRFGSEPDLRVEEEQQKQRNVPNNKHFRKKYRAPPPPRNDRRGGSSPDSSLGKARPEPQRKLRLFKTRNETKKTTGHADSKIPTFKSTYTDFKSLDFNDQSFERRYKSPCKDKDQHLKYPDSRDMMQSSVSMKREERLLQSKQEAKKARDVVSGCRAKTSKTNENSEAWKTPLFNRNFRYSERFKKDDSDHSTLRREKTFDNSLIETNKHTSKDPFDIDAKITNGKVSPLADNKPLRKSLPSLLPRNEEKDEFQAELKKATSRIRSELGNKVNNVSDNKTSQHSRFGAERPNATKSQTKVSESSLKTGVKGKQDVKVNNSRRPVTRVQETKPKVAAQGKVARNNETNKLKQDTKENNRPMLDRGQASGKESTPEHSPTRKREFPATNVLQPKQKPVPSKQFYFGMIESKQTETQDNLKDFPGLGSPIIQELNNFHLIEQKLLSYHDDDAELEKFNEKFKEDCKMRNVSPESALSSAGSEGSHGSMSEKSAGIALRLRPTLPKKLPSSTHFSPAAAWRQLASLDAHLASESQPLAVETKIIGDISAESSPRSDPSADKSGDSGISGDHAHSDHRIDSPSRHHLVDTAVVAWTPQQDLGDSSSEGAGGVGSSGAGEGAVGSLNQGMATYSPGAQPFSLSLPREHNDKGKQLQQGFNSLQKLRKSVSGALGAALGSRRFDLEHEPMLEEPEQNWFLTKSAPNSLSNPLLFPPKPEEDEEEAKDEGPVDKEAVWGRSGNSYVSWGGHVMYLPPPPVPTQPHSMLAALDRPIRSKSSGCLEAAARAARSARAALAREMRERERSASPEVARALPAIVRPPQRNQANTNSRGKRFTFQSTVRQLERRRLAEKLSKEADLKEQQRKTELEAMRRVEEEFQRKRAREKANIRQQLRLVSSGASSLPTNNNNSKGREEPDGSCRESPSGERVRGVRQHSNPSSDSSRSKSTTPIRCVELSEWRTGPSARVYRDWAASAAPALAIAHPPACANIARNHGAEAEAFSGSPRSDNYRLEFARGRSPRTPRPPRLLPTPGSPSSSSSDLSLRAVRVRKASAPAALVRQTPRIVISPPRMITMQEGKPESAARETLEDRDPNSLNQHVQIVWDEVVGEPLGARSPECAWRLSHACFRHARDACYTLLAVVAAPPCALLLGCGFACLAFEQIWCSTPCLRCLKVYFASLRTLVQSCMSATVAPAMDAVGHICRHIRINHRQDAPEDRDPLIV